MPSLEQKKYSWGLGVPLLRGALIEVPMVLDLLVKDNFQGLFLYPVERFSIPTLSRVSPLSWCRKFLKHLIMATAFRHCSSSADSLEPRQLGLSIPVGREIWLANQSTPPTQRETMGCKELGTLVYLTGSKHWRFEQTPSVQLGALPRSILHSRQENTSVYYNLSTQRRHMKILNAPSRLPSCSFRSNRENII